MDTRKIIEEQVKILSELSRRIASGELTGNDSDYYTLLPGIGAAIAALCEAAEG